MNKTVKTSLGLLAIAFCAALPLGTAGAQTAPVEPAPTTAPPPGAMSAPTAPAASPSDQVDQLVQQACTAKPSRCDRFKNHGDKIKKECTTDPTGCQEKIAKWQKHMPSS